MKSLLCRIFHFKHWELNYDKTPLGNFNYIKCTKCDENRRIELDEQG